MDPYTGEIRIITWGWAPKDWCLCHGDELEKSQYQALCALIQGYYGGETPTTFHLPDFRGRVPIHFDYSVSPDYGIGNRSGHETVALTDRDLPSHYHDWRATTDRENTNEEPAQKLVSSVITKDKFYTTISTDLVPFSEFSVGEAGGGLPHNNMGPCLTLNYIICLDGTYPPRK